MQPGSSRDLTRLLIDWKDGNQEALARLMPLVYGELRRIAEHHIRRERPGHMLQPTALIHEAYLKLIHSEQPEWEGRVHFFGVASRLMRQVLVDWARKNQSNKRGGAAQHMTLDEGLAVSSDRSSELLILDDALNKLALFNERGSRAVEMKYFGGLSNTEIAEALGVGISTVTRDLRAGEAWLRQQLSAPA